ncbi:MAG TPA: transketolase [Thermodesulfobacteriota bacterium]|nr:transketolase [Thermodesulfobacteriota bacterium]
MTKLKTRDIPTLTEQARQVRVDIVQMLHESGSGHPGGSLSATDLMVALFFGKMNLDPQQPLWPARDRFVLSKGHGAPAYYAVLAHLGYFPRQELMTLRKFDSCLQGHPDCRCTPGIEVCTGSLGQGLSLANGMALANRLDGNPCRIYVMLGDGELQEGQIWEAAMTAAHYKLDNLTAIVDNNRLQIDGFVSEIMNIEPVAAKWLAFGWHPIEIDGHDMAAILQALDEAEQVKGRPSVIVAQTIKGKGVSIFENKAEYHGVVPSAEELSIALHDLGVS